MVRLSDAEICIMNIIWEKGTATSFDIIDSVNRSQKISEKAIRTLLARMVKKGAVEIKRKEGKTYIYRPIINQDEFQRFEANNFLEDIYQGAINTMLLNFVKDNKLTKKDIEDLLNKIDEI